MVLRSHEEKTMKLLLDIGNTRIKWAWLAADGLQSGGAAVHAGQSLDHVLESIELSQRPDAVCAASVAGPTLNAAVEHWAEGRKQTVRWVRSTAAACGVRNAYAQPERLGVDRWLAVIAGYHRAGGAAFIVDAGTALTVDVVDAEGHHQGGLIGPGIGTMRASIFGSTQIQAAPLAEDPQILAQGTDDAIAWGTFVAALGFIERAYTQACSRYGNLPAYITGGEAPLLSAQLPSDWFIAPDLVLEGLARVVQSD